MVEQRSREFWDEEILAQRHVSWLEDPAVREYANGLIGQTTPTWPIDWFEQWLQGRTFSRALSIGCGSGALERDLILRKLCSSIDAFDASLTSLLEAQKRAKESRMEHRIRYFASDFNEPVLPRCAYDLVLFHQSAHHVAKLEKLYRRLLTALRPDGLLYLDEYIGPSRHEWNDDKIQLQRAIYADLPTHIKTVDVLAYPVQQDDPSEAIRSSEIETQLNIGFQPLVKVPYGGTLLAVIYPALQPEHRSAVTASLIAQERSLLERGVHSYYALMVAKPRRGFRRLYAQAHYFFVPKAKRVVREIRDSRLLARCATAIRRIFSR
jgi:SAM-dependent methyltransferase